MKLDFSYAKLAPPVQVDTYEDCHRLCLDFERDECDEEEEDGGDVPAHYLKRALCGAFTFEEDSGLCTLSVGCDEVAGGEEDEEHRCESCQRGQAVCALEEP